MRQLRQVVFTMPVQAGGFSQRFPNSRLPDRAPASSNPEGKQAGRRPGPSAPGAQDSQGREGGCRGDSRHRALPMPSAVVPEPPASPERTGWWEEHTPDLPTEPACPRLYMGIARAVRS